MSSILPVLFPLIFLLIVANCVYHLPFARIKYSMHVIAEEAKIEGTPISIRTEHIPVDIMLIKCMGGVCGQTRNLIHQKLDILKNGGNYAHDLAKSNHRETAMETIGRSLALIFRADNNNMKDNLQIAPFVRAGIGVAILLLFAGMISMLCIFIHCVNLGLKSRSSDADAGAPSLIIQATKYSAEAVVWIVFLASLTYPAMTWRHMINNKYGPGYIVMLAYSAIGMSYMCCEESRNFHWLTRFGRQGGHNEDDTAPIGASMVAHVI